MITTIKGVSISNELFENYLNNLVNLFFKILPIRESSEPSLSSYMESLQVELLGCSKLIVLINEDCMFLSLVSILQYLIDNPDGSVKEYKREVFKAISICNKLKNRYATNKFKEEL